MASRQHRKKTSRKSPIQSQWRGGAKPSVQTPVRERGPDPDTVLQEARRRVVSLEAALQAMGDFQGPEVDVLKNSLSRAKQAAQTRPVKEQLAQNDAFIQRSQKRIASLERERAEEQALLDKALVRHERLRQEVAAAEPVPTEVPMQESSTEVLFLRAKVAQLEAERIPHPVRVSIDAAESLRLRLTKRKTGNCPEDSFTDESTRSSFLVGGEAVGVARCPRRSRHGISQFVDGTDFQRSLCHEQFAAAVFGGAHGALIGAWREAGYGLRGTRIGEASNPGPRRVRTIQSVGEDVVTSDSDDTPCVGAIVPALSTAHHDCRGGFQSAG